MLYMMRNGQNGDATDFVQVDILDGGNFGDGGEMPVSTKPTEIIKGTSGTIYCRLLPIDMEEHQLLLTFFSAKSNGDVTVFAVSSQHYLKTKPSKLEIVGIHKLISL